MPDDLRGHAVAACRSELPEGKGKEIILNEPAWAATRPGADALSLHQGRIRHTSSTAWAIAALKPREPNSTSSPIILFEHFPKVEDATKINVNKATAQEIATGLGLTSEEAEAVVKYRERHGDFHAWGDLLIIYGVDGKKIAAAKDKISF